jgi:hypothetical protein
MHAHRHKRVDGAARVGADVSEDGGSAGATGGRRSSPIAVPGLATGGWALTLGPAPGSTDQLGGEGALRRRTAERAAGARTPVRVASNVGPVLQRLVVDGEEVTVAMVNEPKTTKEELTKWQGELGWDEDELGQAIKNRLGEIEAAELAAADSAAKAKAEKAAEDARKAKEAERAQLRKEVEDAAGNPLANYDETVDRALRAIFTTMPKKAPRLVAAFFTAATAVESGSTALQVFNQLAGDQVALETFIYANGGAILEKTKAEATDVRAALEVSRVWATLADAASADSSVKAICAQIESGRIRPERNIYRKATMTSTAGVTYRFSRVGAPRDLSEAELHLHPGRPKDLNNAGIKNHVDAMESDRVELTPVTHRQWRDAISTWGLWVG